MGGGVYGPVPNVLGFIVVDLRGWLCAGSDSPCGDAGVWIGDDILSLFLVRRLVGLGLPLSAMLQAGHALKLVCDLSQVRDMMPSSCVFCLAEWFWLFGFDMKQPESLILAQDERWRQA